jgi:serine/threonine-protein kinase
LLLQVPDRGAFPKDWSSDGQFLAFGLEKPSGLPQMWALPLRVEQKPFPLNDSNFRDNEPQVSPDARWLAYESNESGANEIYVKQFAGADKLRLSTDGGSMPRWRADGRALFFRAPNGDIMTVTLHLGERIGSSQPVRLFTPCEDTLPALAAAGSASPYDVAPDGRFLFLCTNPDATPASITVSINWTTALRP